MNKTITKIIEKLSAHPNYGFIFILCMCLLFGSLAFGKHLWLDEIYTISEISVSYLDLIQIFSTEAHPPGYFIGLKFFCDIFGYNLFVMHLFSLIPCIGMLLLGMFPIRKGFGESVSKWFMFLCLTMPFMMWYSNEIRMYTWAIFLTTATFVYAARIIQEGRFKNWILYFIFGILAAYTHYYALMGVAVIHVLLGIYLIIKERKEIIKWIIVSGLFIITYLPWLLIALKQVSGVNESFWITFSPTSWIWYATDIFSLHTPISHLTGVFCAVIAAISLLLAYKLLIIKPKGKNELILLFGIVVIVIVSLFTTVYSILIQPIIVGRYIMVLSGLGLLFFAGMIPTIKNKKITIAFAIIMIIAAGICYCGCFNYEYNTDQENAISNIQGLINPDDVIIYDEGHAYGVMSYYLQENEHYFVRDAEITEKTKNSYQKLLNGLPVTPEVIAEKIASGINAYLIEAGDNTPTSLLNNSFSIKEIYTIDTLQDSNYKKWTLYSVHQQ